MTLPDLPEPVRTYLVGARAALIATVEPDGGPYTCVVGSCVALPNGALRFAAWGKGRTLAGIRSSGRATIVTLGKDVVWEIGGRARVVKDPMDASAFPPHFYAMVEVEPEWVVDRLGPHHSEGFVHVYSGRAVEERTERRDALLEELRTHVEDHKPG